MHRRNMIEMAKTVKALSIRCLHQGFPYKIMITVDFLSGVRIFLGINQTGMIL